MNEPKKPDFFPISREQLKNSAYQDTEEDISHEEYLKKLEAKIFDDSDAELEVDLGELPFDAETDRQRWDELEKDFDRIFEDAKRRANESEPTREPTVRQLSRL